ncbi:MAG: tail fiber domain-containing protein [Bacteroidota bacterium]
MSIFSHRYNNTRLDYNFQVPSKQLIASSPEGFARKGFIDIVISNNTEDSITVDTLCFVLPIGDGASYFSQSSNLNIAVSPSSDWTLIRTTPDRFQVQPAIGKSGEITTEGINVKVSNAVISDQVGTFTLEIDESVKTTGDPSFTVQQGKWDIGKFPYNFFMRNFAPDNIEVDNGESVHLTWKGSEAATYTIFWTDENGQQSENVSNALSWDSPPLTRDTTFLLVGQSTVAGAKARKDLFASVVVRNPDLTPNDVDVSGTANFGSRVISYSASAQQVVDVDNSTDSQNGGPWLFNTAWQSFTAKADGQLVQLSLNCEQFGGDVNIHIYEGEGTSGTSLVEFPFTLETTGWQTLDVPAGVTLEKGQVYTWSASTISSDQVILVMNVGEYDQGSGFASPTNLGSTQDFQFITSVQLPTESTTTTGPATVIQDDGKIGILKTPTVELDVNGTIQATSVVQTSDLAFKTGVETIPDALSKVCALRGVSFRWRNAPEAQNLGLIAQEVESVLPELVHADETGRRGVQYGNLAAVLVEAVKALRAENAELRTRLDALENEQ